MSLGKLLIVDDDAEYVDRLSRALAGVYTVEHSASEEEFRNSFRLGKYDLLIIDMRLKTDREGLVLVQEAVRADPLQAVIVMTAYADMETYADALAAGAMTYLDKTEFSPSLIARTVEAIVEQARLRRKMAELEAQIESAESLEIIGASGIIRRLREEIRAVAEAGAPVLVLGGPGSGKELVARNIHRMSRKGGGGPFIRVPLGAGIQGAREVLFGSGAAKAGASETPGSLRTAKGGPLFLDGISGLDGAGWAALAELLTTGSCRHPVSGEKVTTKARIVVGERPDHPRLASPGSGVDGVRRILIPDLRDHAEDIALLAQYILQRLYRDGRTRVRSLRGNAMGVLEKLPWPGNVRELQAAIAYSAVRADAEGVSEIGSEHLPATGDVLSGGDGMVTKLCDYQQNLARAELALVEAALGTFEATTKKELARRLGYNDRFVFARRIRKCLSAYPRLARDFPHAAEMMTGKEKRVTADNADGRG